VKGESKKKQTETDSTQFEPRAKKDLRNTIEKANKLRRKSMGIFYIQVPLDVELIYELSGAIANL
jgi:hypothetical protein